MSEAEKPDIQQRPGGPAGPEAYVVVARRYRPQTFKELIGQDHVARALTNAIAANRVGHAYLFTGARGVGKTSAARILAKTLDCERGPTPTPCNQCDICQSISAGSDVDVLEIDGASNRGIDEIRQLRQNVNIRPSRAQFKIYIIDEVHMLTREAFNALLKTLEEPPEHVKFIFCTTEATKIPVTILSRCQRFDFAGIQLASIVGRLAQIVAAEGVTAEPEALTILARRAAGSMRDSQSLLEQLLAFGGARITTSDVHAMLGTAGEARLSGLVLHLVERDAAAALADLDGAILEGVDVGQLLEQLLAYFRDLMAAAIGGTSDLLIHASPAELPRLLETSKQLGLETILAILQVLDHTLARLRYSTQGRTLAEMALVRIAHLEALDDVSELIAQIQSGVAAPASSTAAPAKVSRPAIQPAGGPEAKKKAELGTEIEPRTAPVVKSSVLTAENVEVIWKEALANLSDILADYAAACESIELRSPNHLVCTFRGKYNSFHKDFCERPEQLSRLERAIAEVCATPVKIEFTLTADEPSADGTAHGARTQKMRMSQVADRALVRRAKDLFGARVMRIEEPRA